MAKDNCILNRTKLVDEPIVEMLLSKKYSKSGIRFIKSDSTNESDCTDTICYGSGTKRQLHIKRNSSKYYNSPNFAIAVNKNKLTGYSGSSFVFIDEVADCLYIIDGLSLLGYILNHADNVKQSDNGGNNYYIIIPKKDIAALVNGNAGNIIKYGKNVSNLFAIGRDESKYMGLV